MIIQRLIGKDNKMNCPVCGAKIPIVGVCPACYNDFYENQKDIDGDKEKTFQYLRWILDKEEDENFRRRQETT
jgi:hypothetical protein